MGAHDCLFLHRRARKCATPGRTIKLELHIRYVLEFDKVQLTTLADGDVETGEQTSELFVYCSGSAESSYPEG